jgi:hypothetical protein
MQAKKPPRARESLFGPWSKYISTSRKTETAPGSFGCVWLVPHFAQDDQRFLGNFSGRFIVLLRVSLKRLPAVLDGDG